MFHEMWPALKQWGKYPRTPGTCDGVPGVNVKHISFRLVERQERFGKPSSSSIFQEGDN